jgi:hypothetical protein
MFSFNDPEDELLFALFLPCGAVIVAALAAILLPLVASLWAIRALRRTSGALATALRNLTVLAAPGTGSDRVVF